MNGLGTHINHDTLASEEHQYLNLIQDILDDGEFRPDRTGTGTYSLFAPVPLRFTLTRPSEKSIVSKAGGSADLEEAPEPLRVLPLLTTKRVFLRAVIAELLWFLEGATSSLPLSQQGVKIWDGNGSRAFLDSVGLQHREEGDLGPVYGFQWRHFGAEYRTAGDNYTGQGVDQLAEVIDKLKNKPWDRRIILSAWNPADIPKMALPPCHMFAQFYVSFPSKSRLRTDRREHVTTDNHNGANNPRAFNKAGIRRSEQEKGVLHTHLYQRSCDMGLGVPFNIASYALLTHMLAHVCNLTPGTLTHSMGDAHVYLDHVEALEEQLSRQPRQFPTIQLRPGFRKLEASGEGKAGPDATINKGAISEDAEQARGRGVGTVEGMVGWHVDEFVVEGYAPHKAVAMKMSV